MYDENSMFNWDFESPLKAIIYGTASKQLKIKSKILVTSTALGVSPTADVVNNFYSAPCEHPPTGWITTVYNRLPLLCRTDITDISTPVMSLDFNRKDEVYEVEPKEYEFRVVRPCGREMAEDTLARPNMRLSRIALAMLVARPAITVDIPLRTHHIFGA